MDNKKPQITLAICTCNRTGLLTKLLKSIQVSKPCDIANIEVLIVDNHKSHSAINVVQNMSDFKYSLHYISEERAGVPYARNTACEWCVSRSGEAIIFVDDDEVVDEYWLVKLITYYLQRKDEVSIIAGPAYAYFSRPLSKYVPDDLYRKKRPHLKTGASMKSAATNNVIFDIAVYQSKGIRFDESMPFCGGTDNMFFRQAVKEGYKIRWCKEALTYEFIAKTRASIFWLIARHFRYGC
ncbi:MAG: glycosyltransferase family 2 protein, partial [Candidatus Thioglobus sp.]